MRRERSQLVNLTATSVVVVAAFGAHAWSPMADAKTPGQVHCYGGFCHRVKAIDEMPALVGVTSDVVATYYDSPDKDRFNTGTLTSSGEVFDAEMSTRTSSSIYPDGTELLVWNPSNGRAAHVRVNDFGPFFLNRTLDLTRRVADDLGFIKSGVTTLRVIVVFAPSTAEATYRRERTYPEVRGFMGTLDRAEFERLGAELSIEAIGRNGRPRNLAVLASEPSTMVYKYRQNLAQAPEIPAPVERDYEVRVAQAVSALGPSRMDVLADLHAWDATVGPPEALVASLAVASETLVVAVIDASAAEATSRLRRPMQVTVVPEMLPAIDMIPASEAMPVQGDVVEAQVLAPPQQVAVLELKPSLGVSSPVVLADGSAVVTVAAKTNPSGELPFWSQVQQQMVRAVSVSPAQQHSQQLLVAQILMGLVAMATLIKWRTSGGAPAGVPVPVLATRAMPTNRSRSDELGRQLDSAADEFSRGDFARAADSYRGAVEASDSEPGPEHPMMLDHLCNWAKALAAQSDYVSLEAVQRRLTAAYGAVLVVSDVRLMQSYRDLAETRLMIGRPDDAALALEVALNLAEARGTSQLTTDAGGEARGAAFSDMADVLCDLAVIHFRQLRLEPAADLVKRALGIRQQIGADTTRAGAVTLSILGEIERANGNAYAAENWHRQAWALFAHGPDADLTDAASSALSLAGVMIDSGQYASAQQVFEANVPIIAHNLGSGHPAVAAAMISWADLYRGTWNRAGERQVLEHAHMIQAAYYGADHPDTLQTLERLSAVGRVAA